MMLNITPCVQLPTMHQDVMASVGGVLQCSHILCEEAVHYRALRVAFGLAVTVLQGCLAPSLLLPDGNAGDTGTDFSFIPKAW